MKFHAITNVWGERHTELFLQATLPNVLSAGNLPALARAHDVRYRIYTTPADRARIEASGAGRRLANLMPVDFVTPLGERTPDVFYHVHWFHRGAAEAKRARAIAAFVAPDSLWSDGTFQRCGEVMEQGYRAIATPFLQVVAETCVPEALQKFGGQPDGSLRIPARGLYELGMRHLHPLSALAMPKSPHGRPAIDLHWPVPGEGILLRYALRELFAFDPGRCPITFLWYPGGPQDQKGIYVASGPGDMGMLSVDPLGKYHFNYIVGHTITPADLARSTLHPWNVTDHTSAFARRRMYWQGSDKRSGKWRRIEARSDLAMREVEARRVGQRLWAKLREIGCNRAAQILAVALEATPIARRWREDAPLTLFVPSDAALGGVGGQTYPPVVLPPSAITVLRRASRRFLSQLRSFPRRLVSLARRIVRRSLATARRIGLGRPADFGVGVVRALARRLRRFDAASVPESVPPPPAANSALSAPAVEIEKLLGVGAEPALERFLRRHVVPGNVGRSSGRFVALEGTPTAIAVGESGIQVDGRNIVSGPYMVDGITVWIVDGLLSKLDGVGHA